MQPTYIVSLLRDQLQPPFELFQQVAFPLIHLGEGDAVVHEDVLPLHALLLQQFHHLLLVHTLDAVAGLVHESSYNLVRVE